MTDEVSDRQNAVPFAPPPSIATPPCPPTPATVNPIQHPPSPRSWLVLPPLSSQLRTFSGTCLQTDPVHGGSALY